MEGFVVKLSIPGTDDVEEVPCRYQGVGDGELICEIAPLSERASQYYEVKKLLMNTIVKKETRKKETVDKATDLIIKNQKNLVGRIASFPLNPIETEDQFDKALDVLNELVCDDDRPLTIEQADYFDKLTDLVETYTKKQESQQA